MAAEGDVQKILQQLRLQERLSPSSFCKARLAIAYRTSDPMATPHFRRSRPAADPASSYRSCDLWGSMRPDWLGWPNVHCHVWLRVELGQIYLRS